MLYAYAEEKIKQLEIQAKIYEEARQNMGNGGAGGADEGLTRGESMTVKEMANFNSDGLGLKEQIPKMR